jgi:hypothetical protein
LCIKEAAPFVEKAKEYSDKTQAKTVNGMVRLVAVKMLTHVLGDAGEL